MRKNNKQFNIQKEILMRISKKQKNKNLFKREKQKRKGLQEVIQKK